MKRDRQIEFIVSSAVLVADKFIHKKNPTQEYVVKELSKVILAKYPRMYTSQYLRPPSPNADRWYYYLPYNSRFPPEYEISHDLLSKEFDLPFHCTMALYTNRCNKGASLEMKLCSSVSLIRKKKSLSDTVIQLQILNKVVPSVRQMIFNHEYDIVYKDIDDRSGYSDTPNHIRYHYYIAFPFFRFIEKPFIIDMKSDFLH